jgi:hypothetical protein
MLWRHNFVFKRLQLCAQSIINLQLDEHKLPCYGYRPRHSQRPQTRSTSVFQTSLIDWGKLGATTSDRFSSRKWNTVGIWRVSDSGRKQKDSSPVGNWSRASSPQKLTLFTLRYPFTNTAVLKNLTGWLFTHGAKLAFSSVFLVIFNITGHDVQLIKYLKNSVTRK